MKQLEQFNAKAEKDKDLKRTVTEAWLKMERACDPIHKEYAATLVKLGKEHGFTFTAEDIAQMRFAGSGELGEAELDQVAGGAGLAVSSPSLIAPKLTADTLNLNNVRAIDPTIAGVT